MDKAMPSCLPRERRRLVLGCNVRGMGVIGDFRHTGRPDGKAIYVAMQWGAEKRRLARINLPTKVQTRLEALDYPAIEEEMSIEAALSYAVFVGMRVGLPVLLTGDMSVWDPAWGRLDNVDRESPAEVVNPATLN